MVYIMGMKKTKALLAERETSHGDFTHNSVISQSIKEAIRSGKNWDELPDCHKEALEMIAHKIGRWLEGDYRNPDHAKDIAGYATLVVDRLEDGTN